MDWTEQIKAESVGCVVGESYYDLEDLYQAIKERLLREIEDNYELIKKEKLS